MKSIKAIQLLIILVFSASLLSGQEKINVRAIKHNGEVLIKWAPEDHQTWYEGTIHGYTIERYTLTNDTLLDAISVYNSKLILATDYKPEVNTLSNLGTKAADFAKAAIFDSLEVKPDSTGTLLDAVNQRNERKNRYIFYLALADQSFDNAVTMRLGLNDTSFVNTEAYKYRVYIQKDSSVVEGEYAYIEKNNNTTSLAPIFSPTRYGLDQVAVLKWMSEEDSYSSYDIERSSDNLNFSVVNDDPFMHFSSDDNVDGIVTYQDSLPQNGVDYYYRMRGLSYFGIYGPYSDTLIVKGVPNRYLMNISIDSVKMNKSNMMLDFNWTIDADSTTHDAIAQNNIIDHFNILYQSSNKDSALLVNTAPINGADRQVNVTAPQPEGYYSIELIDHNGNQYLSIPHLIQFPDSIPPAIPTGLIGVLDKYGNLNLSWDENTEDDLAGYLVYMSTDFGATYQILVPDPQTTSSFEFNRNPELHIDSLTFAITAVDHRFNESDYSESLDLAKPDNNAPSQPVITYALGVENGIRMGWRSCEEEDVKIHTLEKKRHDAQSWNELRTWRPGQVVPIIEDVEGEVHECLHIDSVNINIGLYDYRIKVEDEAGNVAYSDIKTVPAYDNGIRGQIDSPKAYGSACQAPAGINSSGSGGLVSGLPSGSSNKPMAFPCTLLSWDYATGFQNSLVNFKIYRIDLNADDGMVATPNGPQEAFRLIKTVRLPEAEETALNYPTNAPYAFLDQNGTKPTKNPIKYKIIAEHSDGGSSEWSVEVEVN